MKCLNGDFYEGEWKNGKKEGKGIKSFVDRGEIYEGYFLEGDYHGKGKYVGGLTVKNMKEIGEKANKMGLEH